MKKCPECGGTNTMKTEELYRAQCFIQVLTDGSWFCLDCETNPKVFEILKNPTKDCKTCRFRDESCPAENMDNAMKTNYQNGDYISEPKPSDGYSSRYKPKIDRGPFKY